MPATQSVAVGPYAVGAGNPPGKGAPLGSEFHEFHDDELPMIMRPSHHCQQWKQAAHHLAAAHIHLFHVDAGAEQQQRPGEGDDEREATEHDSPVMAQRGKEPIGGHCLSFTRGRVMAPECPIRARHGSLNKPVLPLPGSL